MAAAPHRHGPSRWARIGLDVLCGLLALSLAASIAVGVLAAVNPAIRDGLPVGRVHRVPLTVEYPDPSPIATTGRVRLVGHDDVVLTRSTATPFDYLQMWLSAAIVLYALHQLRQLLQAVERGRPFDGGNGTRLCRIGVVLTLIGLVSDIGQFIGLERMLREQGDVVRTAIPGAHVGYEAHLSWQLYLAALVAFALAHAFEAGARLQQDSDLTV